MQLAVEHVPTIAVIAASGAAREDEQDLFTASVMKLLDQGIQNIVVDLTGAVSIDSETIGDLSVAYRTASEQSAAFVLVIPSRHFSEPPTGAVSIFNLYDSRAEAIEDLMFKAVSGKIQAETTRLAAEKSRRARIILRFAYALFLIGGLMLLKATLT